MLDQIVPYQARLRPDRIAIALPQAEITYARLADDIARMAQALDAAGVAAGQVVLVRDTRPYVHLLCLMALLRIGAASVSEEQQRRSLSAVRPDRVLTEAPATDVGATPQTVTDADWLQGALQAPVVVRDWPHPSDTTLVRLELTSGTTGAAKVLALGHGLCHARLHTMVHLPNPLRMLTTMGLDVTGGLLRTIAVWQRGGTVCFAGALSPGDALHQLRPNMLIMSPVQVAGLLATLPAAYPRDPGLMIALTGAMMPQRLIRQLAARVTDNLVFIYGTTEVWMIAQGTPAMAMAGAAGVVIPGAAVRIVDDAGQPLPAGQVGLVQLRSQEMAQGYRDGTGEEGATGDGTTGDGAFRDGWFRPGDLGHLDAQGLLWVSGRAGEMLNLGGHKVAPFVVEEALMTLDAVADAAAFGLPDAQGLTALHAAVVTQADPAPIAAAFRQTLALPITLHVMDRIPRNAGGKIDRMALMARHGGA
ncbi:Acyl-CoA synthetase (AMP-forming)/AMP-acid ligase II [Loktanella fryxellensis]|uniref:Acyl-CoA synthetase (AMP-forming)/AMP-acid ligase II n=1 Tax=Loktanella fryxellensis TaxID=245187 RepID=A0A1H8J063_9RHOB|nr:class I adenylate-forming enzyme family protein [Loktanella fryxellensis]SEN74132.1 Acyl-CoA synthetase (AMP-forming)/AMP-acid ligase II [Loktanella fryxellensis]